MDLTLGVPAGDEGENHNNSDKGKRPYHRHTACQTARLEALFLECPHPDENQRRQIAIELGLEPKQIKFWFQNKRTQRKTQSERADNTALRAENERMQSENIIIREALKTVVCPSCGGPPFGEEEHKLFMQKLKHENARLKDEYEKVTKLLASYMEKTQPELQLGPPDIGSSYDSSPGISLNLMLQRPPCLDLSVGCSSSHAISDHEDHILANQTAVMEKALMSDAATAAMKELVRLLCFTEPLWAKSSSPDRKLVIHRENYEKQFPRANHFKGSDNARVESSRDARIVRISAMHLVDMILNSDKWANFFSTIITRAKTIKVLESGSVENRSGALLLMHEEMHVLSPLVPSREFYFLRYCKLIEAGVWVIADVSIDYLKDNNPPPLSWRLPSGCMIHELPNGSSKVTWVEHVKVDDKIPTHPLYGDLVYRSVAYGAERWLMELQKMCERFESLIVEKLPCHDPEGVINLPEGKRSVMQLSHRMVKSFCGVLNMSSKLDNFPHFNEMNNNSGVRLSVRKNTETGQPNDVIVMAATSFWIPLLSQVVFEFFREERRRAQWDALSCGNSLQEIARISNGIHPGNCISVIRPFNPTTGNNIVLLQESFIDPVGAYVVYAPVEAQALDVATREDDSSRIPVLPSGITITGTNAIGGVRGSLLTVAFQILVCGPILTVKHLNMETVAAVNTLIASTVQNITDALNCSGMEH